ncbi:hypothetical protein MAR_003414 [Mya arenaria]|uniref:Uncharacterized protein n=1 Tax=Mya arenaria TaxID=6604 RepID=A0ABY7GF75_MYAAR|nr:hypothetical protein MAR_003414 [Mya arenaria]
MNPLKCVIVIIYYFGVIQKGQSVFVSQRETKWDESPCILAEPAIICRNDGSWIMENGLELHTKAIVQDNGFWIGYAKTWISFAYVGCNAVNDGVEYSVSTLGECRRTTGCKTFGIRNSTATHTSDFNVNSVKHLTSNPKGSQQVSSTLQLNYTGLRCKCASNSQVFSGTCRRKCEEADQYPCGDTTDTTMYSIYTVEKDNSTNPPVICHIANTRDNDARNTTNVFGINHSLSHNYKRGMLWTCFKNAVIEKTTAEVSTAVANQQRVEYVNTTSDGMHRNTGDTRDAQTYEKLNMTSSSDNYLSLQEIDTDRHFYQNT